MPGGVIAEPGCCVVDIAHLRAPTPRSPCRPNYLPQPSVAGRVERPRGQDRLFADGSHVAAGGWQGVDVDAPTSGVRELQS